MVIGALRDDFKKWQDENYCLEAVRRNGYALQYVKEQSVFEAIVIKLKLE